MKNVDRKRVASSRRRSLHLESLESRHLMAAGDHLSTFDYPFLQTASDMGASVAAEGDLVVVGAPRAEVDDEIDVGAVFVYRKSTGELVTTLHDPHPDPRSFTEFGDAVAIDGGVIAVNKVREGGVYLFDATSGALLRTFGELGNSVALQDGRLAIGVGLRTGGLVRVYDTATGELLSTATDPTPTGNEWFGASIALENGKLIVGAPRSPDHGTWAGAAYVYDATTGVYQHELIAPQYKVGAQFGTSIAVSGGQAVVGAIGEAHVFDVATGAFLRTLDDGPESSKFGTAIAIDDAVIAVGSPEVSVTTFDRLTGELLEVYANPAPGPTNGFGASVAILDNALVVGAPLHDEFGARDTGAALLIDQATHATVRTWLNQLPAASEQFGSSVAITGQFAWVFEGGPTRSRIVQYDLRTGNMVRAKSSPEARARFGGMVASDKYLAVGGDVENPTPEFRDRVYIFDPRTGALLRTITDPDFSNGVFGSGMSIFGDRILIGDRPASTFGLGEAYLYDLTSGELLHTFRSPEATQLGTYDDFGGWSAMFGSNVVISATTSNAPEHNGPRVYVFDAVTGELTKVLAAPGLELHVPLAISDRYLAVSAEKPQLGGDIQGVAVFNTMTWELVHFFNAPVINEPWPAMPIAAAISGTQLFVGVHRPDAVYVFDIPSGTLRDELEPPSAAAQDSFGTSVVATDQYVLVGAPEADEGVRNAGGAYLYDAGYNDTPILSASGQLTFEEGDPPLFLSPGATLFDYDSPNFAGGTLTVSIANGSLDDRVRIRAGGGITLAGNAVTYNGVEIGTYSGATTRNPLRVELNGQATQQAVQALVRRITFHVLGDDPSPATREVSMVLTEADGTPSATSKVQVHVIPYSLNPVLQFESSITYVENSDPQVLAATSQVTDADSAHFATGTIRLAVVSGAGADDRWEVRDDGTAAGAIGFSGGKVTYGGQEIATVTGGSGSQPLVITFTTTGATPQAVTALLRNLTFRAVGDRPVHGVRKFTIVVTDGDGGTSNIRTGYVRVLAVNDPVTITVPASSTYYEDQGLMLIAPSGTVTDPDAPDFRQGILDVNGISGFQTGDLLSIRNQGTQPGQIAVRDQQILYGGVVIGEVQTAASGRRLYFRLNSSVTLPAVQALVRNLQFSSSHQDPSTTPRVISFRLVNGQGQTFTAETRIAVQSTPESPQLVVPREATYRENAPPLILAPEAVLTDADSVVFDGGYLRLTVEDFDAASELIGVRDQGMGAGQIGTSEEGVFFGGIRFAEIQHRPDNKLQYAFNENATIEAVQALIRNIQYSTTRDDLVADRRLFSWVISDGHGGWNAASTWLSRVPVNDAPRLEGGGTTDYTLNAESVALIPDATATDPDSANFAIGALTVSITSGADVSNRLSIGGAFTIVGNEVQYEGASIGTINSSGGVGTTDLVITFNTNATLATVQQLIRAIRFSTVDGTSTAQRVIKFSVTDGDGGQSNEIFETVNVSS